VEQYLNLLGSRMGRLGVRPGAIDAAAEAFRWAEQLHSGKTQAALNAGAARADASDPVLAELVRKRQDAEKQIDSFQTLLTDTLAAPTGQQDPSAVAALKRDLKTLNRVQAALQAEIERRYPPTASEKQTPAVDLNAIQAVLTPTESFVAIHPTATCTYIWAIPAHGRPAFAIAPLDSRRTADMVAELRKALDPKPSLIRDIPAFDLALAHELYRRLLEPVRAGWENAREMIVSVSGPLAALPLAVLPTAGVSGSRKETIPFEHYNSVPWLIRQVAITRVPSATALLTTRRSNQPPADVNGFAGFGDPFFNLHQAAAAVKAENLLADARPHEGSAVVVRGIRVTNGGDLDSPSLASCTIDMLQRLPDTRQEILGIADAMGADLKQDIFLGRNASESRVKAMDLSGRRVIAFATHALLPGDLDGLHQPALALSSPAVTGDPGDGLLTMEEILRLRLNADWVVLSACNTGAAEKEGEEAISGLGQAFFYAGAKAILVTLWPVETTSARMLTTRLFRLQKQHPELSRSQAHRRSILHLIDEQQMINPATGQVAVSYAHPIFWAPFIIVGNGSRTP